MRYLTLLFTFFILSGMNQAFATDSLTVDDIINQESAVDFEFSPDGEKVAWVKRRPSSERDRFVTDLYLTDLTEENGDSYSTIQLTRTEDSDSSPFFSREGNKLYFQSSRDDGNSLWALDLRGGEPVEVNEFDEGFSNVQWMGESKIAYLSEEGDLWIEQQREQRGDATQVIEDTTTFKPQRVYSYDLESGETERITDNDYPINSYSVSEDGRWLVSSHTRSVHYGADAQPPHAHYLWDLENDDKTRILRNREDYQQPGNFEFTEDVEGFYFTSVLSSDPEWEGAGISLLHYFDLEKQEPVEVDLEWENGISAGYEVVGNDVVVSLADDALRQTAYYERRGNEEWRKHMLDAGDKTGRVVVGSIAPDHETVIFSYSTASTPNQYWLGEINTRRMRSSQLNSVNEITKLNSSLREFEYGDTEIHTWAGANDAEINGILYYPQNYDPDRQYPLVVKIHGGPAAVDLDQWRMGWAYYPHLFTQEDAFVLFPNYHGSSNHGLEFVESIKGRYYEQEVEDIVTGAESLIDAGMVDADSLGIMGWSNGSILGTMTAIQHPDMFQALGAGAGTINWASDYGTCRFGVRFNQSYIGGAPWDQSNGYDFNMEYIQQSPLFHMERKKTPTLISFGSEDRAVPRDQGWEHYRAMQQLDQAPVRFLWFPGEPHSLQQITHQTRKLNEEFEWFQRYLFDTHEEENIAFNEESPLAELLERDKLERNSNLLGKQYDEYLIPETKEIASDSLEIGRVHVTNAQYASFDDDFTYPEGRDNYPVTGISGEKADQYLEWLSDLTGRSYRLPESGEAERLHRIAYSAASGQNTLNQWAGYDLTIDEVSLLMQKVNELDQEVLMEPVAQKSAVSVGEAEVYDLGGNAAEWYNSGNGNYEFYGYSAASFHDPNSRNTDAPDDYISFRVILEP